MRPHYAYLIVTVSVALFLSYTDHLIFPLINIFFQIFTFERPSPVFPFTIIISFISFAVALICSRNVLYSLTLPFAFLGLYELLWHAIPNTPPIDILGVAVVLSWASVGFVSAKKWRINNLTIALIGLEIIFFALWYLIGFSYSTIDSVVLNTFSKVLLAVIFMQVFYEGANPRPTHHSRHRAFRLSFP